MRFRGKLYYCSQKTFALSCIIRGGGWLEAYSAPKRKYLEKHTKAPRHTRCSQIDTCGIRIARVTAQYGHAKMHRLPKGDGRIYLGARVGYAARK